MPIFQLQYNDSLSKICHHVSYLLENYSLQLPLKWWSRIRVQYSSPHPAFLTAVKIFWLIIDSSCECRIHPFANNSNLEIRCKEAIFFPSRGKTFFFQHSKIIHQSSGIGTRAWTQKLLTHSPINGGNNTSYYSNKGWVAFQRGAATAVAGN